LRRGKTLTAEEEPRGVHAREPEGKSLLGRPSLRWEDILNWNLENWDEKV
jgi:hypothetical protein